MCMHLRFYLILSFLFFVSSINAQEKQIVGDTAYWFSHETRIAKKIELRDLENSSNSFEFRFSNGYQFVEMWESNDTLAGVLTSYTRKLGKKYDDPDMGTFFTKIILPREGLEKVKSLLDENKMSKLPSDNKIAGWRQGCDGISYRFQFSSPEKIIYNTYWTPQIYDTLAVARKVLLVVDSISNLFNLEEAYENLFKTVPQKGTYSYGVMSSLNYSTGGKNLGYSGSLKMPYGLNFSAYVKYLGNLKTDFSVGIEWRVNTKRDYSFDFSLRKSNIFFGENDKINGSLYFLGRERRIETIDFGEKVHSTNLAYLLGFPKQGIGIGVGVSHIFMPEKQTGLYFDMSYRLKKIDLFLGSQLSFFSNRQDYRFYLQKGFNIDFRDKTIYFKLLVFSEKFRNFSDTGVGVSVLLF